MCRSARSLATWRFWEGIMALMRETIRAAIMLVWMFSVPVWAAGGYVHEAVGEVLVAVGKAASQPVVKNNTITSDTIVTTGEKSHSVLKFEDGQIVAMQAETTFNVHEYRFEPKAIEKSNIVFSSIRGGLLFVTGLIGKRNKQSFRLTTPNATIGIRGTEFMVVIINGVLYGKVASGSISLSNKTGEAIFEAGQTILVSSPEAVPVIVAAESVPEGIFSQLEAIQLPLAESPLPASNGGGMALVSPPPIVAGSTLLNSASLIAGGVFPAPSSAAAGGAGLLAGVSVGTLLAPSVIPASSIDIIPDKSEKSDLSDAAAVGNKSGLSTDGAAGTILPSNAELTPTPTETTPEQHAIPAASSASMMAAGKANPAFVIPPSRWYDDKLPPLKNGSVAASLSSEAGNGGRGDVRLFGKHNFTPDRVGTGEICIFCHTPQGSEDQVAMPLWNRTSSQLSEYKAYSSIGSATAAATGSVSMACLSCHDGTQAPNIVINSPPDPQNTDSGDPNEVVTKNYLKDHHPVSMLYAGGGQSDKLPDAPVDALAAFNNVDYDAMAVRELTAPRQPVPGFREPGQPLKYPRFGDIPRTVSKSGMFNKQDFRQPEHSGSGSGTIWWLESQDTGKGRQKKDFYLYTRTDMVDGRVMNRPYVECASCHDPHSTNPTFLRIGNGASAVCLTCHAK